MRILVVKQALGAGRPAPSNCEAVRAASAEQGAALAASGRFGAVLLDWDAGVPAAEQLSPFAAGSPATPVLVRAGRWNPEDAPAALRAGAYLFLPPSPPWEGVLELAGKASREWRGDFEVVSGTREWLALRVACKREPAERLNWFLRMYLADIAEGEDMVTVVRELAMNCIEHACGPDGGGKVEFDCIRGAGSLLCRIRDPGPGFSLDELPHAAVSNPDDAPLNHVAVREESGLRPGGYGILLARKLSDELLYSQKGNEVLAIKYRRETVHPVAPAP